MASTRTPGFCVVHQRAEQRVANHVLRLGAIQRLERLQADGRILVGLNRSAQRGANLGIVTARAQQIHGIETDVRIKSVIVPQNIEQHALHAVVVHRALKRDRLPRSHLQFALAEERLPSAGKTLMLATSAL